jgi:hypothetical protein
LAVIADRILVFLSIFGLVILAIVTAREMGLEEGRKMANLSLWEVPPDAHACRVYPDGGKVCIPYGPTMKRSKVEWKRMTYFQERLGRVK